MYNHFYVPPHLGGDPAIKPLGVRTQVRRNQPQHLDMRIDAPGAVFDGHDLSSLMTDTGPRVVYLPRKGIRQRVAETLIRLGERLMPHNTSPFGQPAI
ncbi:MAG: hypothetical protein AAGL89_02360 [Pseudomonadota bacterium]